MLIKLADGTAVTCIGEHNYMVFLKKRKKVKRSPFKSRRQEGAAKWPPLTKFDTPKSHSKSGILTSEHESKRLLR